MPIQFRHFSNKPGYSNDFHAVFDFLVDINRENVITPGFLWGRWAWAFSLPHLDRTALSRIGIWSEDQRIVALATYEHGLGYAYFLVRSGYESLKREILIHATEHLAKDGKIKALIPDGDRDFQRIAVSLGFRPTQEKECTALIDIDHDRMCYSLPAGFSMTSLKDSFDMQKYNRVLWRGFNHGDEPPADEKQLQDRLASVSGPHDNMALKVAVVSPEGEFVSYCGMWYDPATDYALVEPVATDPDYRRMGLGKAAVLEGIRRCAQMGAKTAYVGSSQQFYYSIGFAPVGTETFWERTDRNFGNSQVQE